MMSTYRMRTTFALNTLTRRSKMSETIQDNDWIVRLKEDLIRVNRSIQKNKDMVDISVSNAKRGVNNIKELEQERENLIDSLVDTDNVEDCL